MICRENDVMFENLVIQDNTDLWRGVILHGKNASTYKIALAQLLIDYSNRNYTKISHQIESLHYKNNQIL